MILTLDVLQKTLIENLQSVYESISILTDIELGLCDSPCNDFKIDGKRIVVDYSDILLDEDYADFEHAFTCSGHIAYRRSTGTIRVYQTSIIADQINEDFPAPWEAFDEFIFAITDGVLCIGDDYSTFDFSESTIFQLKLTDVHEVVSQIETIVQNALLYFNLPKES